MEHTPFETARPWWGRSRRLYEALARRVLVRVEDVDVLLVESLRDAAGGGPARGPRKRAGTNDRARR